METKPQSTPIGQSLIQAGVITLDQLEATLQQQKLLQSKGSYVRLGDLLVRNRFCTQDDVLEALSIKQGAIQDAGQGVPLMSPIDCARLQVIPVELNSGILLVKSARPLSGPDINRIMAACTADVHAVRTRLVDRHEMHRYLSHQMSHDSFEALTDRIRSSDKSASLMKSAIDSLLREGIERGASDIHLDLKPDPDSWVSFRVDSIMRQTYLLPDRVMAPVYSRLKTLSGMDASNSRTSQDGRMAIEYRGRLINFRLATQPLVNGETLTIRINDASTLPGLDSIYPAQEQMQSILNGITRINGKSGGLVLVTGPTGSGKSTTLYTLATRFPRDRSNIITVEDPVEYDLPFARQIQFGKLLNQNATDIERSILRQDPDVLIFGEIRDADSARAALKFAESGHLVLATLHAKNASQSVERLLSMLPPNEREEASFVIAATLLTVVCQLLYPRLCACSLDLPESQYDQVRSDIPDIEDTIGRPLPQGMKVSFGCPRCDNRGYRGRVAIHETLSFSANESMRRKMSLALSQTRTVSGILSEPGVTHLTRRQVSYDLMRSGIIDAKVAATAITGSTPGAVYKGANDE